ncbi:TIGR04076 family protein [Candidatus Cloacimonadota bacterium]
MKELKVVVEQVVDHCGAKLKPGDTFYVTGKGKIKIPDEKEFCMFALQSLIPFLINKQLEIKEEKYIVDMNRLCCPDPGGVVFQVSEK